MSDWRKSDWRKLAKEQAREMRVLRERIAELGRETEDRYLAMRRLRERIAELEAALAKEKERWATFNHEGQPWFGMAHHRMKEGDIEKADEYLEEFLKVWDKATGVKAALEGR